MAGNGKFTFIKPGVKLVEVTAVPIRHIDDIGRIDIMGDKVVVTLIEMQPGESGQENAIVVDKIAFQSNIASDMVQFFWSALAQAGVKVNGKKPLLLQ